MSRFGDSKGFYEHFSALIRDFATVTLLDLHPPGWFQIEGNLGGVAAVNDALVRCVDSKIHLLCSLPEQWRAGAIRGLKTPGGHILDMIWEESKPIAFSLTLGYSGRATVSFGNKEHMVSGNPGETFDILKYII
jgi:alpha-L-fucosidase 2